MKRYWKNNRLILAAALVLSVISSALTAGISVLLREVVDAAAAKQAAVFEKLCIFTVIYILLICGTSFFSSVTAKFLTGRIIREYRRDVFRGIMGRRPSRYYQENTADYISALTNDMKLIEENYITALLNSFELIVMLAATLVILVLLSPLVTALLMATFLLMLLIPSLIGRYLEKRQTQVSRQMAVFTEKLKDLLSGYEILKSYSRTEDANDCCQIENETETRVKFRAARLFALNEGISDTLSVLSVAVVLFTSAWLVLIGRISTGTLLALVQLSSTFTVPIIMLMQNLPKVRSVKSVIARLNDYADSGEAEQAGQGIPTFEHEVELKHVSFSYDENTPVLSDVSMRFEKGKKYAVMGPSGCGKSTLLKLMTGCFEGYGGSILYDGRELNTLNPDRIAGIASLIHQNVYLFNWSVRENILLHEDFSVQELEEAVKKSGVSGFLSEKENGLDYMAGENGSLLSGGQRQRIALARALIRRTPLVILDEGTSALDRETAHEIESRLLEDEEITLITITHNPDPELITRYDRVYQMGMG